MTARQVVKGATCLLFVAGATAAYLLLVEWVQRLVLRRALR